MIRFLLVLILPISLLSASVQAQEWDIDKISDYHEWTFRMTRAGDSLGYTRWSIRRMGEQLLLSEESRVPSFSEDIFMYVNAASLQPDSALVTGRMSGYPIECKAHWQDGQVSGFANFPRHPSRPTINLGQALAPGTVTRFASFVLSPFYKALAVGDTFSYDQFNTTDGQVRTITATVTAIETVMVMGQSVEALKLELSGGVAAQNLFIDPKRSRIVKISFRDIDWIYELISD